LNHAVRTTRKTIPTAVGSAASGGMLPAIQTRKTSQTALSIVVARKRRRIPP
jgi:hypothetical protein